MDLSTLGKIPKKTRGRPPKSASSATTTPTKDNSQTKITSLFKPAEKSANNTEPNAPSSSTSTTKASTKESPSSKSKSPSNTKNNQKRSKPDSSSDSDNDKPKKNNGKEKQQETEKDKQEKEKVSEKDSTPAAKKRGRPPGKAPAKNQKKSKVASSDEEESEEEYEPKKGKKVESEQSSASEGSDSEVEPPPKKRTPTKRSATKEKEKEKEKEKDQETEKDKGGEEEDDNNNEEPKKKDGRGRKSNAERAALKKQGKAEKKKSGYIKKGEPGYVRPVYNYVRKTPAVKAASFTPIVEEESPLCMSEFVILPQWMPPLTITRIENVNEYLPKSLGTIFKWEHSDQTTTLDLFHTCLRDAKKGECAILGPNGQPAQTSSMPKMANCNSVVMNVGGPIWNIDWCPLPLDEEDELSYLAVASYTTDVTHNLGRIYRSKNIIQIWSVGSISDDNIDLASGAPKFCFGIAHEGEAAVFMKWCPLGGYAKATAKDAKNDRLGLLAVSFLDGSLNIFSVPHPNSVSHLQKNGISLVLNLAPVFTHSPPTTRMTPEESTEIKRERERERDAEREKEKEKEKERGKEIECGACVRCIDWSVDSDWALLLVGSDNGTVSVWNLLNTATSTTNNNNSNNNIINNNNNSLIISTLPSLSPTPFLTLPTAHKQRITGLVWSPTCKHQFITVAQDGFVKFWDLRDPFHPLYTHLVGGAWMQCLEYPTPKLPFFLIGMDDDSLRMMDLIDVSCCVNKWHFGPIWGLNTNLFHGVLATCSSDGSVKYCRLNEKSSKKKKAHLEPVLIEQFVYESESNMITFSSVVSTPTIIPNPNPPPNNNENENENNNNNNNNSAKKKGKGKKKDSDNEGESDDNSKKGKKKKPAKKDEEENKTNNNNNNNNTNTNGIYLFPPEKLQINQVKWNPRNRGNRWLAFGGNSGLLCLKVVQF